MHWLYRNDSVLSLSTPLGVGVEQKYQLDAVIGVGATATVALAINKITGEKVAVKVVEKKDISGFSLERLQSEVKILQKLKHTNIIRLHDCIESETKIFLILDYCEGGELRKYIDAKGRLSETEARLLFRQMVAAVGYCHQSGVCHRDIKLENILLDKNNRLVKIIDFGLAKATTMSSTKLCAESELSDMGPLMSSNVGTLQYAAPEILEGGLYFGHMVDVWSLGVVLYCMATGRYPFQSTVGDSLVKLIIAASYPLPDYLSDELKELISKMLVPDPMKRYTMEQVKNHPWVNKGFTLASGTGQFQLSKTDKVYLLPNPQTKKQRPRSFSGTDCHPPLELPADMKPIEEIVSHPNSGLSYHHMMKRAITEPVSHHQPTIFVTLHEDEREGASSSPVLPRRPSGFLLSPKNSTDDLLDGLDEIVERARPVSPTQK